MYRCTDIPVQDGVHPPDLTVINYREKRVKPE